MALEQFLFTNSFFFLMILLALIAWHFMWVRPLEVYFPTVENHIYNRQISGKQHANMKGLRDVISFFWKTKIKNFNFDYWFENTGIDATAYLYFQRIMIFLIFIYLFSSILLGVPYLLYVAQIDPKWYNRFTLQHIELHYYYQIICVYAFSILFFVVIHHYKTTLTKRIKIHLEKKKSDPINGRVETLKLRSLIISGIPQEDRR